MDIQVKQSTEEVDRAAAAQVSRLVMIKPNSVLGLATGDTTVGLHREMVALHKNIGIEYSGVSTCNLDEYAGISADDPRSCRARIDANLLNLLNIKKENTHVPDGLANSLEQECKQYENKIATLGGIDLQIISIGENGHIAFNEPGTPFETTMRIAEIAESTVKAKTSLFGTVDDVPRQGITMGIKDIMMAKRIILIAKGAHKAEIVNKALFGAITVNVPASVLQLHPALTVFLDNTAAAHISGA